MASTTEETAAAEERMRITVYVDYEDLATLDELRAHVRRTQRRNPDRSEIIRQAIRTYRDQQTLVGVGR